MSLTGYTMQSVIHTTKSFICNARAITCMNHHCCAFPSHSLLSWNIHLVFLLFLFSPLSCNKMIHMQKVGHFLCKYTEKEGNMCFISIFIRVRVLFQKDILYLKWSDSPCLEIEINNNIDMALFTQHNFYFNVFFNLIVCPLCRTVWSSTENMSQFIQSSMALLSHLSITWKVRVIEWTFALRCAETCKRLFKWREKRWDIPPHFTLPLHQELARTHSGEPSLWVDRTTSSSTSPCRMPAMRRVRAVHQQHQSRSNTMLR